MEKLSDILNNFKERISNPFIFSFLWAWIILNWEIIIGLFWLNAEQVRAEGYRSIFDLIECNSNTIDSIFLPLAVAFLYVALGRNILSFLHTFSVKWGNKWNLIIADNGSVSINDYLESMKEIDNLHKNLQNAINQHDSLTHEISTLKNQLQLATEEKEKAESVLHSQANKIQDMYQLYHIEGKWKFQRGKEQSNIEIDGYKFYLLDDIDDRRTFRTITTFIFNPFKRNVIFVVSPDSTAEVTKVYNLEWQENFMTGTENGKNVKFTSLGNR